MSKIGKKVTLRNFKNKTKILHFLKIPNGAVNYSILLKNYSKFITEIPFYLQGACYHKTFRYLEITPIDQFELYRVTIWS